MGDIQQKVRKNNYIAKRISKVLVRNLDSVILENYIDWMFVKYFFSIIEKKSK